MESLAQLRDIIAAVLQSQIGDYHTGTVQDTFIQSKDLNRFLVICTGWFKGENFYGITQDVELREDGTVLIHADYTTEDLAEDLVEAGIPANTIIKAYDPDAMRQVNQDASQPEQNTQRQAA